MGAAEEPIRHSPAHPATPVATLDDVDIQSELEARPRRVPNLEREHRALLALGVEMANRPGNMLQKLAELAIELCGAHTAGVSVPDGAAFRWAAVAGVFAPSRGATVPRDASPDDVCIVRNATQLMFGSPASTMVAPGSCARTARRDALSNAT